jgi:hypothetical protein
VRFFLVLICAGWALTARTCAKSPVTLTIDSESHGFLIPPDFAGLGFETYAELPNHNGVSGRLFSPANAGLITLFTNSGIRNLRLGGGTVDGPQSAKPSHADIDSVFGFARAAGIKVIYSLPLLNGNPDNAAATAKYIWNHYQQDLVCFSIGNEPNEPPYRAPPVGAITNYACYLAAWKTFAAAITNAVPAAKFSGPESGGPNWVTNFAADEGASGMVAFLTHHEYFGGNPVKNHGRSETSVAEAIDQMLSRNWVTNQYPHFYNKTMVHGRVGGLPYRMTELNDYLRGVTNASDAFASALWALDCLHWWAARGYAGVNFHNNQWLRTDTVFLDQSSGEYQINPKAYAIRAFDLGSHGSVEPVVMGNAGKLNLTAYAVGDSGNLCVTIINKEHGPGARSAVVTIKPGNLSWKNAEAIFLTSPNDDAKATAGISLGGAPITNHAPWQGQWNVLTPTADHWCQVTVPATSAVVVKLSLK